MIQIRKAHKNEAKRLTHLAIRSKAYWGYSEEFMEACRKELFVTEKMIENNASYYAVAVVEGEILGFYSLNDISDSKIELGLLFVEPTHIGSGMGRILIEDAKNHAKRAGGATLHFQGDPNAEGFYRALGATLTGKRESSSIPGRFLPTFSISLISNKLPTKPLQID